MTFSTGDSSAEGPAVNARGDSLVAYVIFGILSVKLPTEISNNPMSERTEIVKSYLWSYFVNNINDNSEQNEDAFYVLFLQVLEVNLVWIYSRTILKMRTMDVQ